MKNVTIGIMWVVIPLAIASSLVSCGVFSVRRAINDYYFPDNQASPPSSFFTPPSNVTTEYRHEDKSQYASFSWSNEFGKALFGIYTQGRALSESEISSTLSREEGPVVHFQQSLIADYGSNNVSAQIYDIQTPHFAGKEILFMSNTGSDKLGYDALYLLNDSNTLWQGQLSGNNELDRKLVHEIIGMKENN